MNNRINQVGKAGFYHIDNIRRIWSKECLETLFYVLWPEDQITVTVYFMSCPDIRFWKLQGVQNTETYFEH